LQEEFGSALSLADVVVLTDIYPAGEDPIPGVSLESLAAAVSPKVSNLQVVPDLASVAPVVAGMAQAGDLIITLGAGSIGSVGDRILALAGGAGRGPS